MTAGINGVDFSAFRAQDTVHLDQGCLQFILKDLKDLVEVSLETWIEHFPDFPDIFQLNLCLDPATFDSRYQFADLPSGIFVVLVFGHGEFAVPVRSLI